MQTNAATTWRTSRFVIDLRQPRVMGIVNVTPDSFSDGGVHAETGRALRHAEALLKQGADILDLGGESTRPGAPPVPLQEERARVVPVVREAVRWGVPISIDTYKPEVMAECLALGADIINDVWALRRLSGDGATTALDVVAQHPSCGVVLMHMHRQPQDMQAQPMPGDAVPQVRDFLAERAAAAQARGVARERIVLDYGIGFGKTVEQNLDLLARQGELLALGYPLLAGWSRKSTLGRITGQEVAAERVSASVAAALLAVQRGARIVRVHDVAATVQALKVWQALSLREGT
ncbi:MAG: dihydropteroate synthase [Tepidimonas sp.]|uniref:dihydropteroate synthase n=1 Tax=Tepidimonas sp. TaxID=2002775 RepID=UPI00298F1CF0|nr:dihydropteroate synthase [Tepidimonas sp.]MCS6811047.1 dihydropteroate synthase [Tepidimonas sp.]MCX7742842.1 dihydropteroate synthase [Tepidimonas sp.]MDW8336178.1 dihydropteroate synthase [Tepidimonas sp.]